MLEIVGMELSLLDRQTVAYLLTLLSAEKQARIKGFCNDEKAAQSLCAELLARSLACSLLDVAGWEIVFATGPHGKPYLPGFSGFHFNVSHSASRVLCVADSGPVGVDIELMRPIDLDAARIGFSADEQARLMKTCPEERLELFYDIWTLKESYAKAAGLGFNLDPKSFTVMPEGEYGAKIVAELPHPARYFKKYRLEGGYRAAVCANRDSFPDQVRQFDLDTLLERLGPHPYL